LLVGGLRGPVAGRGIKGRYGSAISAGFT
jgi:hypothetical protein